MLLWFVFLFKKKMSPAKGCARLASNGVHPPPSLPPSPSLSPYTPRCLSTSIKRARLLRVLLHV
jgi:hypothetical protein